MLGKPEAAREVNRHIIEAGKRFDAMLLPFVCECGCLTQVLISTAEYEAHGGAFLPDHAPMPPNPSKGWRLALGLRSQAGFA